MSTNRAPLFKNAIGKIELFGADETLTWDFTSGTGNPMELVVGGSTYFTFDRTGALTLESNILWNSDSGGTIGAQYTTRPSAIHAATSVAVGAVSGVGDGSSLTLTRLTIGHGNVDKYIDAEQGLANTPAMRYNAVNTRWEFSDDGITYVALNAVSGATTWDAIYLVDKSLIIDSTTLTFNQTSTTGVAFALTRDLDTTNTDSPVFTAEQINAADDQPPLALGQGTTAASGLDIYEGTVAAGTLRYTFGAAGQLAIATKSTVAGGAISITQNDDDVEFITLSGTSAAGATKNISTANGVTADMWRIDIGGNTRWVPAYTNVTLPGAVSWDGIYLVDKYLDIDAAVLQFEQTATSGNAFEVFRNLAQGSTTAPIMLVDQQNTGDDQAALQVTSTHGGAIAAATLGSLGLTATSGGIQNASDVFCGAYANTAQHASDAAGSILAGYGATTAGGVGSATTTAFYSDATHDYGLYSLSQVYIEQSGASNFITLNDSSADLYEIQDDGAIVHDPQDPTAAFTAHTLSVTSGGMVANDARGLSITMTGEAATDANNMYGIDLLYTDSGGGGATVAYGVNIDADWAYGIYTQSLLGFNRGTTTAFMEFTGNPQADASGNISTVNAGADMLRVSVDDGGGQAVRWVPSYDSHILPSMSTTWDAIYAAVAGSTLTVSTTDKPFDIYQTSTQGPGLQVRRNATMATSGDDDALVYIYNPVAGDCDTFRVVHGGGASGGATASAGVFQILGNNYLEGLGVQYDAGGNGYSRGLWISDASDATEVFTVKRSGILRLISKSDTNTTPAVYIEHNEWGEAATIINQKQNGSILELQDSASDRWVSAVTGAVVHTPATATGAFDAYTLTLDAGAAAAAVQGFVLDIDANTASSSVQGIDIDINASTTTADLSGIDLSLSSVGGSGNWYGINIDANWDYGVYSTSPGLFDVDLSTAALTADQARGTSNILLLRRGASDRWSILGTGAASHTPAALTGAAAFDAYTLTLDAGDASSGTGNGFVVDVDVGLVTGGAYNGIDLNLTTGGSGYTANAIDVGADWDYGLYSLSPAHIQTPGGTVATLNVISAGNMLILEHNSTFRWKCNNTGVVSTNIDWSETTTEEGYDLNVVNSGNLGAAAYTYGFYADVSTTGTADADSFTVGYGATTASGAGGGAGYGFHADNTWDYGLYSLSPGYIDVSVAGPALYVEQNSTGNFLTLNDGTTDRFEAQDDLRVTHTPVDATTIGSLYNLAMTSGGIINLIDDAGLSGFYVQLTGHVDDSNTYLVCYDAYLNTDGGGDSTTYGFRTNASFDFGLYTESRVYIETSDADPAFYVSQNSTGEIAEFRDSNALRLVIDDGGPITHTPADPTVTGFVAHSISVTSGGLAAGETFHGLDINLAGIAADNNTAPIGISLAYTAAAADEFPIAIVVNDAFNQSIYAESRAYIADNTTGSNAPLKLEQLNASADAEVLEVNGSADSGLITFYNDGRVRHTVNPLARTYTAIGAGVGSSGVTTVTTEVMTGYYAGMSGGATDGSVSGSLPMYGFSGSFSDGGGANTAYCFHADNTWDYGLYSTSPGYIKQDSISGAVPVLTLTQDDVDEVFTYFSGTASDPAAGSAPAGNITEVNGAGAVVGPQTTSGSPDTGWAFNGMVKMKVDAVGGGTTDVWIATYTVATS